MRVLGIETSCDETAVAVVEAPAGAKPVGRILANVIYSQQTEHRRFGGVVPEIAARAHLERIDGLIEDALAEAKLGLDDLDAIAATGGPGLIGGVMVGVMAAKGLAFARNKPFLAINHLEGHALTVRLTEPVDFPYLLLLVSGGHCQLLTVRGPGDFTRLGTTIDDAVGECFDKTAKLLGLGFPGGPAVERLAKDGDAAALHPAAADVAQAGLRLLLLRPQDRGAPDRREARPGRWRARAPISAPPSSAPSATFWPTAAPTRCAPRHRRRWWWQVASPPTSICAAAWKTSPASTARAWSRRR